VSPASINALLKDVSRSFYLTLRVLPSSVRSQIGLAYLLARTTDTIADSEMLSLKDRLEAMQKLRERVAGRSEAPVNLMDEAAAPSDITDGERALLERAPIVFEVFDRLGATDRQRIREVLEIIISGQELDLTRFGNAKGIVALEAPEELDDYTYRVAGCVGEFWTRMCRAHVFPDATLDDKFLLENGVRFGKGLQLVNVLRDIPRDLRNGRCYLPARELAELGLQPGDLLKPANEPRFRPVYDQWLARADAHLRAGWEYTNALPRNAARVRLACAWPILIGLRTLERLKVESVLDPERRIKVCRSEVRRIIAKSIILRPFPKAWSKMAK
jgi:farnesyl-diphosphate farnesyltransferase